MKREVKKRRKRDYKLWFSRLIKLCFLLSALGAAMLVGGYFYLARDRPAMYELEDYTPPVITQVFAGDGTLIADSFGALRVPLRVVTADLESGTELVLAAGSLRPALLASAALPGIFPPVRLGEGILVDGAIVNLVPISHALAGPVDRIFVLDVSDPMGDRPLRSPLDVVVRDCIRSEHRVDRLRKE